MSFLLAPIAGLFGAGASAGLVAVPGIAGAATLTPAAAGLGAAAAGGFSLSTLLQGGATVLGLVSSIQAGRAEQERLDLMAQDADREQPLETLQGIDRRRSLKAAAMDAIGEMDVAYAGSGVDLSFGTAAQARTDAFRETDLGLTTESGTTMTRLARLTERAANYRRMGKRALQAGIIGGFGQAMQSGAQMLGRY
jgi:hypothetical protein